LSVAYITLFLLILTIVDKYKEVEKSVILFKKSKKKLDTYIYLFVYSDVK